MEDTGINNRIFYLAGGDGSRFGANKLLYPLEVSGRRMPMYRHGLEALLDVLDRVATYELYVVTCHMEIYEDVRSLERDRVYAVYSPHSPFGLSHTIRAGLEAAGSGKGLVYDTFLVADMPGIHSGTLEDFMEKIIDSGCVAGCVTQQGRCKNPVMFRADLEPELLALTGDAGGKSVFLRHKKEAFLYEYQGDLRDIDRREDLAGV